RFGCSAWSFSSRCCPYIALVTLSTPVAFLPSSDSKHARRLSTVKWCISDVYRVCGACRARWAIRSIPVVVIGPPLRVVDVVLGRALRCVPLCSVGVTPPPRSYGDIRLPLGPWASSWFASCATLLPSLEESRGPPEFPTLPW